MHCQIYKKGKSLGLKNEREKINKFKGVPTVAEQKRIQLASMRLWVPSLASLSGLRIWRCWELWCRSQTWLGSGLAVGGYSSD